MRFALAISIVVAVAIIAAITLLFAPHRVATYRDKIVIAGEISRPVDNLLMHISTSKYVVIKGKTYKGVRGRVPYYLDLPAISSILIVTDESDHHRTFHIINLLTGKETSIAGSGVVFGQQIGYKMTPGAKFNEWIESYQSNKIMIAKRSDILKVVTTLNLDTCSVGNREVYYYDQHENITNHITYSN